MKATNFTPVFEKDDKTNKANYRPISILPNLSNVLERCLYSQFNTIFVKILPIHQWGFQKDFSVQHCVIKNSILFKLIVQKNGIISGRSS